MNPSSSHAGLIVLITIAHIAALWWMALASAMPLVTMPAPLPAVMVEMLPAEKPPPVPAPQPVPTRQLAAPEPVVRPEPPKPVVRPEPPKPVKRPDSPRPAEKPKPVQKKPPPPPRKPPETVSPAKPAPAAAVEQAVAPPAMPTPQPVEPAAALPSAPVADPVAPEPPAPTPVASTPPRFNAAYLSNPVPAYPAVLRRAGEEGRVVLRVLVTAEGSAGEVQVLKSASWPAFDKAAVAAVRKWRFVPARRGDIAVAEWVQVPIAFKLN